MIALSRRYGILSDAELDQLRLAAELDGAVGRGELCQHLQSVIELATGRLAGVEALLRWNHPRLGVRSPAEILPLAEHSSVIHEIGAWTIEAATAQLHQWGHEVPPLGLSINLHPTQLVPGLVAAIDHRLRAERLAPASFCVEISERTLPKDLAGTDGTLAMLHDLGVRVAIDDFGTAEHSLLHLGRLPVDLLKLDPLLFREAARSDAGRIVTRAIVQVAHDLGVPVVCKHIETPEQLALAQALDVDYGQGYLLGAPAPPGTSSARRDVVEGGPQA